MKGLIKIKLHYTVNQNDENKKIGSILREKLFVSARLLNKLKMNGKILVNGLPVFSSYILKLKDEIIVNIDFEEECDIESENMNLDILYEDDCLIAINKPAGIVVHPSSYHPNNTLSNGVKFYLNDNKKIRPINRLDRDTSGIVLFAKNEYIQELMNGNFDKEYLAIVNGVLNNKCGEINKPIARKPGSIMEREVNEYDGQSALTYFDVLKEFKIEDCDYSLVHLKLGTGRTHQIRVHLSYLGNSILGDSLYGKESNLINRQSLHAWKVSFIHPIKKHKINIEAPIPNDMKLIIEKERDSNI